MRKFCMGRRALPLLLLIAAVTASASERLSRMLASPAIDSASTAIMITDLRTGEVVESHNISVPLLPASIMKAVTTAALIDQTGISYRYRTKVFTTGNIHDGILDGNLIIQGSGDPTVNASSEPKTTDFVSEVVNAVVKKHITEIKGRIIFDEDIFAGPAAPPSWHPSDRNQSYGTGQHGFNFEQNRSGKAAVANPEMVFEKKLRAALSSAGVTLDDETITTGHQRLLTEHVSAPMDEIMRSCMMRSDNLYAECLLRLLAIRKGKEGSTEAGADQMFNYWKRQGADGKNVRIVDGSGLSRANRMTAEFMTHVLRKKSDDPYYVSFFPLAGEEGTLRNFMKGTSMEAYLAMKTGSMNGVQCYAGYKLDDDYAPTHTVVIILNNFKNRASARAATSRLLLEIFDPQSVEQNNENIDSTP